MRKILSLEFILLAVLFIALPALAQDASAPAAPAEPHFLDGILAFLQGVSPSVIAVVAGILEFVFRVVPTSKALSLLVPIKYVLEKVGAIFAILADWVQKVIEVANNVKPAA